MVLEKQKTDQEEDFKKEIYLESSLTELPSGSLTELEKYYQENIQLNYPNK